MRKNYVKPALISEEFIPQTYVAACAEEPGYVIYSFECTAGKEFTHSSILGDYQAIDVYVDGVDITGWRTYSPCNKPHTVKVPEGTPITEVFEIGYMDDTETSKKEAVPVYVWRGEDGENCHCMANPGTEHIAVPKQMS